MKIGGYFCWSFSFCSTLSLSLHSFGSAWEEKTWWIWNGQHWVLFSVHGDRKGPALVYKLTHSHFLCFPECHRHHSAWSSMALCQHLVAMATLYCSKQHHQQFLVKTSLCHPCSFLWPIFTPRKCGVVSVERTKLEHCTHVHALNNPSTSHTTISPPHISSNSISTLAVGFPDNRCGCSSRDDRVLIWSLKRGEQKGIEFLSSPFLFPSKLPGAIGHIMWLVGC